MDRIYAVIDPHLWPSQHGSLPEDIAAAGLPAACLFDLDSDHSRADTAPWLIDLTISEAEVPRFAPTSLHRRAFAKGTGPGCQLFLRSPLPLVPMRQSLRKLTKVQDTDGKWYFNRFWEPEFFLYFVLFLEGRRMLAPLADLTGFALASEGRIITARTDLRATPEAPPDREGDLDLLFEAGTAMVALRHARRLEKEFLKGCNTDIVYALAKERFGLVGMDYRFVMKCVDISYSMVGFFGDKAGNRLTDETVRACFDSSGQLSPQIEILHGLCMFGLRQGVSPDLLHSEVRFGS